MPAVSIIVLNYNGKHFLADCINSIKQQTFKDFELILVDNASSDGSVELIKNNFPEVMLIESPTNLGFAGGNNLGVSKANGDLIVLLNNDTKTEIHWLEELVKAVSKDNVAIASSLILSDHIPMIYWEKKGSINFLGHNIMFVFDKEEEIFTSSGASLIFKKNLLGLPFDEDYFAYSEDVYLGLRARFSGYNIVHTNKSVVHHYEGGSFKKTNNSFRTYIQERNRLLNTALFFSFNTLIKLIPLFIFNICTKLLASLFLRKDKVFNKYSFKGLIKAYLWFPLNAGRIIKKRAAIKKEKLVSETEIIKLMSYKVADGNSLPVKLLNKFWFCYFYLVGIKTIEFYKK